ncbi:hypothetical protein JXA40_07990 [bacterium]|nr:hypothetical protein [candidate division CSSED10-310 bacterium]
MTRPTRQVFEMLTRYLKKAGVSRISILGEAGQTVTDSGGDFLVLVTFKTATSLLELVRMERELKAKLETRVRILNDRNVDPMAILKMRENENVLYEEA